jgi:hypothetical protein
LLAVRHAKSNIVAIMAALELDEGGGVIGPNPRDGEV